MTGIATATQPEHASSRRRRMTRAAARRWPTGAAIAGAAASLALWAPLPHQAQTYVSAWCVLLAAVIYLTWGTARGGPRPATAAMRADRRRARLRRRRDRCRRRYPSVGRFVLASGWLGHAIWDAVHHRANWVVPRWYAEPASSAT